MTERKDPLMRRRFGVLGISAVAAALVLVPGGAHARGMGMVIMNGLATDALVDNKLTTNPTSLDNLVSHSLSSASFAPGTYLHGALEDPNALSVMRDIVQCALGPGDSVQWVDPSWTDGVDDVSLDEDSVGACQPYDPQLGMGAICSWSGTLGLCPEWQSGAPTPACRQLVSACVLARNNAFGVHVPISLRGQYESGTLFPMADPVASPAPASCDGESELSCFGIQEGAFFGDIFDSASLNLSIGNGPRYKSMFACTAPGWSEAVAYMEKRICAGGWCAATWVGTCNENVPVQLGARSYVCSPSVGAFEEDFEGCSDTNFHTWLHPITTHLDNPCELVPADQKSICTYSAP
jgi:hypothetical protein